MKKDVLEIKMIGKNFILVQKNGRGQLKRIIGKCTKKLQDRI